VAKSRPKAQPRGDSNEAPKLTAEQGVELYHLANVVAPPFTFTGFTNNSTVSGQGTSSSHSPSRQAVDTGRTVFRKAMTAYVEGNYGESAELLEQAQEKEPLALDVQFYLGVCRLLIGQPQAAIEPLQRAASVKGPMLQQQAHYFLAKAYLQGMQFKEAEEELKAAAELTGPLKADSAALLKRLRALRAQLENN
jgi:tetratricopeptide (TPR) repeat protein